MEHIKRRPVSEIVEDLTTRLLRVAKTGTKRVEQFQDNEYLVLNTGVTAISVNLPFVMQRMDWYEGLSKSCIFFAVTQILPQLRAYNMLWHRQFSLNGQEKRIMALLKKKEIIYPTEGKDMYIVNPFLIWRGSIPGVIMATRNLVGDRTPTQDMIIDLQPPERTEIRSLVAEAMNMMKRLNSNEIL